MDHKLVYQYWFLGCYHIPEQVELESREESLRLMEILESFKRLLSRVLKASGTGCQVSFQLRQELLYFFIPIAVPLQLLCNNLSIINRALFSSHLEIVHSLHFESIKFPYLQLPSLFTLSLSDCLQATSSSSVCILDV